MVSNSGFLDDELFSICRLGYVQSIDNANMHTNLNLNSRIKVRRQKWKQNMSFFQWFHLLSLKRQGFADFLDSELEYKNVV